MLDFTSISGLAICFGPLALVLIGFIIGAVLTDLNSRRTYLRQMDLRPEHEQPPTQPVFRSSSLTAETPTGARVTILPTAETGVIVEPDSPKPSKTAPAAAAPAAPVAEAPAVAEPDELTKLEGIGPKISEALIAAGLDTFAKVAAASQEDFQAALEASGMSFAPSAESWAEQASYAAKGDWDGLDALQDTLVSGRYPTDS